MGTITMASEEYDAMVAERDRLRAENERLRNSLSEVATRIAHDQRTQKATDSTLDGYLAAGISAADAERDTLRTQLAEIEPALVAKNHEAHDLEIDNRQLRTQLDEARELLSKALNNIPPNFALSKGICKWLECTETRVIQTPVQVVDLRPKPISNTYHIAEALDALIKNYDSEIHSEHDGTSMLDSRLSKINFAREALAAYRAAKVNEE